MEELQIPRFARHDKSAERQRSTKVSAPSLLKSIYDHINYHKSYKQSRHALSITFLRS